jgi:LemA protein
MKKGLIALIVVVIVGIILVGSLMGRYNSFVSLEEGVEGQWGNVENVYQRRADLIPNLVATVKGYAEHERETLEAVINARAKATQIQAQITPEALSDPSLMGKFQAAQGQLTTALGKLMVVMERYPDLKANQGFLDLQAQLEGTENRIAVERRRFNEVTRSFNTAIRRFPGNILAGIFGFEKKAYFEAEAGAEQAPEVSF